MITVDLVLPWWDVIAIVAVAWFMCVVALPFLWDLFERGLDMAWIWAYDHKKRWTDRQAFKRRVRDAREAEAAEATSAVACACQHHADTQSLPVVTPEQVAVVFSAPPADVAEHE